MQLLSVRQVLTATLLAGAALLVGGAADQPVAPEHVDLVSIRRLNQDQYRGSIAQIFGDDIRISAHLEPDPRREGLIAIGVSQASITGSGFEQYDAAAREIATQVTDKSHRDELIGCEPTPTDAVGKGCARAFLSRVGRLLYRRPLADEEVNQYTAIAAMAGQSGKDFHASLGVALAAMLESPPFLFRTERSVWTGDHYRLDDWSMASRLGFLLWNAPPDGALLAAAERGDLRTPAGIAAQVDRMMASPRFEQGVGAFFGDMLALDQMGSLQKDPIIYPRFNARLAADAREQALRTIIDTLVRRDAPYAELFTTRSTFLTRSLGLLYGEPLANPDVWEAHTFPASDPRAGLFALPAFLMTYSHPGRSSPVLRGKAIRELLLCQPIPAPPPNVNFAIVQDTSNPHFATARQRDLAHNNDPSCAGCHKLMDPLGLTLENFDGSGSMRSQENGTLIDLSGEMNHKAFVGAEGLGRAVAADPASGECLARRLYAYGVGREVGNADGAWFDALLKAQQATGLRLRGLLRAIATSDAFAEPLTIPQKPPSGALSFWQGTKRENHYGA